MESAANIQARRFRVALSFAGEQRTFVEEVAGHLTAQLGEGRVFYDRDYTAELARPNFDTYLTNIYLNESDLIVVFLSADYERKDWCGLEWRGVRSLILARADSDIMPFTFDGVIPVGMLPIDGYIAIEEKTPQDVASLILERLGASRPPLPRSPQNIPRSGAAAFVGRDAALERLDAQLRQSDRLAITAIAGMGGIGKTELAMQYAQRRWQAGAYAGGVCWVLARQTATAGQGAHDVGSQIVAFARSRLQVTPPEGLELPDQVAFCWQHWRSGEALVAFDDVSDYTEIEPYLPPTEPRFKVLITTRRNFGPSVASIAIDVLEPEDALSLLANLAGEARIEAERPVAQTLCARLGYLPLGLELVGRYLAVRPDLALSQMQTRLESRGLESAALAQPEAGMTARLGVQAAFELSWETLSAGAQQLGCLLSLLAEAPIPWPVAEACLGDVDAEALEEFRDGELLRLHLLQRHDVGVYRLHALIRAFFRDKLEAMADADRLKTSVGAWAAEEARQMPESPTRDQIDAAALRLPHLAEAAAALNDWVGDEALVWPYAGVSRFYEGQGAYTQAEPWRQQCLSAARRRFGESHPDVAGSLNNLAMLYNSQGRYDKAEPLLVSALEMSKALLGDSHPDVATSLNNLALLYGHQGRYDEAEPLFVAALEMRKALLGDSHPDVAGSLHNLAVLYRSQGRYDEAEPLYVSALEMLKALLGDSHPDVATSLDNLAGLYDAQGRYDEAESLYVSALEMRQSLLGKSHPDVAMSLNNRAILYVNQGDFGKAAPLLEQALDLFQQVLGAEHPNTQACARNLAWVQSRLQ